MKVTKKSLFALGAAVMMTASLATIASAATNVPADIPDNTGVASVQAVDVDLSGIDFSKVPKGELVTVCTIDPDSVDADGTYVTMARSTEADIATIEAVDVDLSAMDFSKMLEGTPVAIGTIDPSAVTDGYTTASRPAEKATKAVRL